MSDPVQRAYQFAKEKHAGQKRLDGRPYFVHPELVWKIARDHYNSDEETQVVALIHDTLEDSKGVTPDIINDEFGHEVLSAVLNLTNDRGTYLDYLLELRERYFHFVNTGDDKWGRVSFSVKGFDMLANYYDSLKFPPPNKHTAKHLKNKVEMGYYILFGRKIWEDETMKKLLAGEIA